MATVRYNEDPAVVDLAKRRTRGILDDFTRFDMRIQTLAASCYCQGLRDAADAVAGEGEDETR